MEREAKELAREAAIEKAARDKAIAEERAAVEKKIAEEAAAKASKIAREEAMKEAEIKAAEEAAKAKIAAEEAAAIAAAEATEKATAEAAIKTAEAVAAATAAARAPSTEKRKPIKFKDAVGRKFSFPFHLCNTWPVSSFIFLLLFCVTPVAREDLAPRVPFLFFFVLFIKTIAPNLIFFSCSCKIPRVWRI